MGKKAPGEIRGRCAEEVQALKRKHPIVPGLAVVRVGEDPASVQYAGRIVKSFSGNYSKFVGFTELNFPLFEPADDTVPLAPVPAPVVLTQDLLKNRMNTTLLQWDAGVVQISGKICNPDPTNPPADL